VELRAYFGITITDLDTGTFTMPDRNLGGYNGRSSVPALDALKDNIASRFISDQSDSRCLQMPAAPPHLFLNTGFRFSTNAAIPSFWSTVANIAENSLRSKRIPSASVVSKERLTLSLVIMAMGWE
jgi:hypothetical protein